MDDSDDYKSSDEEVEVERKGYHSIILGFGWFLSLIYISLKSSFIFS